MSGLIIDDSVHVAAAPEAVWRLLVDTHSWRHWWPGCLEVLTVDRKQLHDGSQFSLRLKLGWVHLRFQHRVEAATAPKTLVWSGRGAGMTGRHAFWLEARSDGTFVRQQETILGGGGVLYRLLRIDRAAAQMFHANLRGLKRMAERAV